MKKFLTGCGIFIIVLVLSSSFLHLFRGMKNEPSSVTYRITYQTTDGEEIKSFLFKENGNYPTEYTAGRTARVDDLLGKMTMSEADVWWDLEENELPIAQFVIGSPVRDPNNPNTEYEFYGWYLDKACKKPFDGVITSNMEGDIVLYADIVVAFWTKYY